MPKLTNPVIYDKAAGKRFLLVRKFLKLNQEDMAKLCEISQSEVSKIESGNIEISQHALKNLFIKKNINPNYIIIEGEEMEYKKYGKGLVTNINDLRAEIEIMKAHINLLFAKVQAASNSPSKNEK